MLIYINVPRTSLQQQILSVKLGQQQVVIVKYTSISLTNSPKLLGMSRLIILASERVSDSKQQKVLVVCKYFRSGVFRK